MEVKIYVGKDNGARYYYKDADGKNHFGSYPRILMEKKLGRPLELNEDVHHIDGNSLNNDLENLEVVNHGEHQREHAIKYSNTIEKCVICGKSFQMTRHGWSRIMVDIHRGRSRSLTCSKSCAGKAGSGNYLFLYDSNKRFIEIEDSVSKSR